MTRARLAIIGASVAVLAALTVLGVARWRRPTTTRATTAAPVPSAAGGAVTSGRRIKARLFYVADDGLQLEGVERDVPYGEGALEQAKALVAAQLAPVDAPLVSAIPTGTTLRALFITGTSQAYVDLSREVAANHPGGAQAEALTVYTIVEALTVNLPAITSVQLLVDGKEVETLAGHVDLRRALVNNPSWIR